MNRRNALGPFLLLLLGIVLAGPGCALPPSWRQTSVDPQERIKTWYPDEEPCGGTQGNFRPCRSMALKYTDKEWIGGSGGRGGQ